MALPWYCTREDVKSALDIKETARNNPQIDRNCDSAARSVENLTRRVFYPHLATRYFEWPNTQSARSWRLWLNKYEVISVVSLYNRGAAEIPAGTYFLEPSDGPPYTRIELDIGITSGAAAFGQANTWQRAIALNAWYGYRDDRAPAGTVVNSTATGSTTLDVSSVSAIGVGSTLIGAGERMFVTGKTFIDGGATLGSALAVSAAGNAVVTLGAGTFASGEVIMIDAEKMRVEEAAGATLVVTRAWDGSTLAAHSAGAAILAPRRLTVARAQNGSTAVVQAGGASLEVQTYPALIRELAVAEALTGLLAESGGYTRSVGSSANARGATGIDMDDIRQRAMERYGKQARIAVI